MTKFTSCRLIALLTEHIEIDELVTGGDERARGLALAETVDCDALFTKPRGKPSEIAVTGNDAEAGEATGIKQVHGVMIIAPSVAFLPVV